MPHRRGSFHEDWNDLLERFAHRGTPAALEDQLRDATPRKDKRNPPDPHQALYELAQRDSATRDELTN